MITIQIETDQPGPLLLALAKDLADLQARGFWREDPSRVRVANLIRFGHALGAHIGGHHVAVHPVDRWGFIRAPRLAIITGTGPDWV